MAQHFALASASRVNEILHDCLVSTWFYKHEVCEVPELVTALLVTYDTHRDDEFQVQPKTTWQDFLDRMDRVKPDWAHFSRQTMEALARQPEKAMLGWEGRTLYCVRGGQPRVLDHRACQ